VLCAEQPFAAVENLLENRLRVRHRAADHLQHLGGGGLLLERFPGLVEQPRVLDSDGRLQRQADEEFQSARVKRLAARSPNGHRALDGFPGHEWRHHQPFMLLLQRAGELNRA
jgi:hypothetical protein